MTAMLDKLFSMGLNGMDAYLVEVEAYVSGGLPRFDIVGLPDVAVKESRERVRSCIKNHGFTYPASRITVNLAPADTKKTGPLYDLPITLSILLASKQIRLHTADSIFLGELSLSGELRKAAGVLPMVIKARQLGYKKIYVPEQNAPEGSVIEGIEVYPVKDLDSLLEHLLGRRPIQPVKEEDFPFVPPTNYPDFSDVKGQQQVKRAMEIAAAGSHNLLLIGPPGSGKSMLARRLPSILPDMTFEESIETTKIHSIAGVLPANTPLIKVRPFRSPHHTVSAVALSGGGTIPKPGEVSLAHNGVLFLDELPEFSRTAIEGLRQPIEDGQVSIARVAGTLTYPCDLMLVAAMNPCPCGFFGHPTRKCTCAPGAAAKYINRISGPLLDRLDIHVEVPPVEYEQLSSTKPEESSQAIRERVNRARTIQLERYKEAGIFANASLQAPLLQEYCRLDDAAQAMMKTVFDKLGLSARGYDRILKVSRTIADLEGCEIIHQDHIAEAIQYRTLDRKYWQER